jgi:4-amino-4-deoxy-L-arabinose transferase-like glycosyltransferase
MEPHVSASAAGEMRLGESTAGRARAVYSWLAVVTLTAIWFALGAGRPLNHPDEGRYAEIPREMLASGDWVTPHLNDLAYLEKPPLQYWATAVAYRLMGSSEWTARLPTMLAAWLNVVFVFLLGRRLWNFRTGLIAAALLASAVLHFAMGQILTLDMAFTCLMTAMLCAFCMAQLSRDSARRASNGWTLASWVMLGLATLTKGVVALVIAGSVLSIYMLWQRDWAVWRTLRPGAGLAVLLIVTAPWFVLVSRANHDFLEFFFIHEHFQRYLTDSAQRVEPWWYFLAILAAGVLPWPAQMASALINGWRSTTAPGQFDARRLLWLWCVFVLVFFSLSGSKLPPYVLPVLPPLALLTAARESSGPFRWLSVSVWIMLCCALAWIVYVLVAPSVSADPLIQRVVHAARPAALMFGLVAALAAFFCRRAALDKQPVHAVVSLAVGWFLGLSLLFASVGHEGSLRSGRELAARIPPDLAARAPIFSVQTYDQTLTFYLRRTLTLVDTRGELDYGLRHEPEKGIGMRAFEQRWLDLPEAVAIMSHTTYSHLLARGLPMRVLGMDRRRVAVSRQ